MEVKIEPDIDIDELMRDMYRQSAIEQKILQAYELACIDTIKAARNQPSPPAEMRKFRHTPNYIDNTANLRKSLGYAIFYNGQLWKQDAPNPQAKATISKAATDLTGVAIGVVLVAGEKYATYVEAKGYNVLTAQWMSFEKHLKRYLSEIKIDEF